MADVVLETQQLTGPGKVSVVAGATQGPLYEVALETTQLAAYPGAVTPKRVGGGGAVVPSIVSAANRSRVAQNTSGGFPLASAVAGNGYAYWRSWERAPARPLTKLRPVFANIIVGNGFSTTLGGTLPASINGGRQEQGPGCATQIRASLLTGISSTALNQGAATATTCTFNGAAADATFTYAGKTWSHIYKLDNAATPPAVVSRTYAQFQVDGGAISASTVNGATLAASQVTVPDGYIVIPDEGPSVAAGAAYFAQLETRTPVVSVSTVVPDGAGSIVVSLSSAGDIGLLRVGNFGTISGATSNTSVNGTWLISAINTGTNTITMSSSTATSGAVTGTPALRFGRPVGNINANVTANPLGDYLRSSATQQDYIGKGDWTGLGGNLAADGSVNAGFALILGEDASGGKAVVMLGDSIASEVRDGQTNSPSALLQGDGDGNLAFANRILGAAGLSWFRTAVPGMRPAIAYQDGSDSFRLWVAGFADVAWTEMGRNTSASTYGGTGVASFKVVQQDHYTRSKAALKGSNKRLVASTMSPATTQVGGDNWKTGRNSTYQTVLTGANFYPTGYFYANFHPDLKNGVFADVDGVFDLSGYVGNLDGSGVVDGYWPVDGATAYKFTTDGTHPSKDGHTGIAAQVSPAAIKALLGA